MTLKEGIAISKDIFILDILEDVKEKNNHSKINLSDNKKIPKVIFKIKKYYVMYIYKEYSVNFDLFKTVLGDLELRETMSSKGTGLGIRLNVVSRGQVSVERLR